MSFSYKAQFKIHKKDWKDHNYWAVFHLKSVNLGKSNAITSSQLRQYQTGPGKIAEQLHQVWETL